MESSSSSLVLLSQLSFFPSNSNNHNWVCKSNNNKPIRTRFHPLNCQKMFVPGFGEASPEAKAAKNLNNFFTFVAVKIVTAQLESYNFEAHQELMDFLESHSLNDGDKFLSTLMRESSRHKTLALRILEVRSAYCKNDFEWDNLERLAKEMVEDSNIKLMREYVSETSRQT